MTIRDVSDQNQRVVRVLQRVGDRLVRVLRGDAADEVGDRVTGCSGRDSDTG